MNEHVRSRALLEQHFDIAFAAPDGINKLRELILTLAMQGKLVPQDPNDQPASQLLKEIEAEKRKLVKAGKIREPKPLPEIKPEDVPYELPVGWEWVRLGSIGNIFNGNSINSEEKASKYAGAEGLPYIATKDVGYGPNALDYENGISIPKSEVQFKVAHKDAVLICAEGGSAGKKCGMTDRDICFGNKLFAIELFGGISSGYILYMYLTPMFRLLFTGTMSGIIGGVSIARFMELMIPLPPIAEQKRIVARIDQLMARCDELEKLRSEREAKRLTVHISALNRLLEAQGSDSFTDAWHFINRHFGELYSVKANVTELRKAILQLGVMGKLVPQDPNDQPVEDLLARIIVERRKLILRSTTDHSQQPTTLGYEIPESWKWQCLDNILVFGPTNGFSPKAVGYETSVRSLTLTATTSGVFKGEHSKYISGDIPFNSELWLRDGDILVQRGNTLEYVGVPAVYRGKPNCFIYPDLMMKLRVSSEINSSFIHFAMSSEPCREFLRSRASGTSGTMPKINQATLKSLPVPIPPFAEQNRIVAKIDKLMALCDQLEQQIDATANKQSVLLNAVISRM